MESPDLEIDNTTDFLAKNPAEPPIQTPNSNKRALCTFSEPSDFLGKVSATCQEKALLLFSINIC